MLTLIVISVLITILFLYFLICILFHRSIFGKRWEPDGVVQYYTQEEFGLSSKPFSVPFQNYQLRGFYYSYPIADERRVIVFAHGMWGSHKAYLQEIEWFARQGYLVLGFDYAGTDLSGGKNIRGLGNSLSSLVAAVQQVKKDYPTSSISVVGHSWGGFAAASIAKYHPDLSSVIAMSAFVSVSRQLKTLLPKMMWFLIPGLCFVDICRCGKYSLANTKKILKNSHVPTLLVHSKDDSMVHFAKHTGYLQHHLQSDYISYLIVDGKRHNPDYCEDALKYTSDSFAKMKQMTKEEKGKFYAQLDFHRMGALDEEVMESMLQFLKTNGGI